MKYLLLFFTIFSSYSFTIPVNKELDSFATEGLVIADDILISSSMKEGSLKYKYIGKSSKTESYNGEEVSLIDKETYEVDIKEFANNQLNNWKSYHRIMGVSFDKDSRRVFFLSPNYQSGAIISFAFDSLMNKSIPPDFIVHIINMGLVNDIKIDYKSNVILVSNFKSGDIFLFFKEELLVDKYRKLSDADKMGHEIDSANGLYLEGHDLFVVSTSDQAIYKINIYSGFYDLFSKLDDGFPLSGGWPDDMMRIDSEHFVVSDNKNGGLYLLDNNGKLIRKVSLSHNGENLISANMAVHKGRLYFSHLWKADLMNIILTEVTPEDYDFNEYSSGTYSVDVKSIVP